MSEVPYMERTRAWYEAQGYERAYHWAHFDDVPFEPLPKPLSESTVAVVTTAALFGDDGRPVLPKSVYSRSTAEPPETFYTEDLAWDRQATHLDDRESYLPLARLRELATAGRIGALAENFHGLPTDYSQRRTMEIDAPELLARIRADGADIALLVPL
jgi:D-proline reductase (dithiol) PrdB